MRIWDCNNVHSKKWWKQITWSLKFLVFKKMNIFPIFLQNDSTNSLFRNIPESLSHWWEIAFQNLSRIRFDTWALPKNQKIRVDVLSLVRKKIEKLNFCCLLLLVNLAEIQNFGYFRNFKKKWKNIRKCHVESVKSSSFRHCFKRNQRWNSAVQRWRQIWKISSSTLLRSFEVINSVEPEPKQIWIRADQR